MAEAMSEERLAELERRAAEDCNCGNSDCEEGTQYGLTPNQANELLAEVKRLRALEAQETPWRRMVESDLRTENAALRAAQPQLTDEYGLRIRHISTLTEERAIADTLDGALEVLAAFDAKGRADVVSRTLRVRKVGEWQDFEEAGRG